jgi:hypothetical protein
MLTLYTTPVIYLYMDRFRLWTKSLVRRKRGHEYLPPEPAGSPSFPHS